MKRKTREQRRRERIQNIALAVSMVAMWAAVGVLVLKSLDSEAEQHISGSEYRQQIAQYAPAEPVLQREVVEPAKPYDVPLDADLQHHIIAQAEAHGIDPAIIFAIAYRESSYNAAAIGDNGNAIGLLQIWPYWHSGRMERLGCTDLLDPFQNVTVGIDFLAEQIDRYDGDVEKALTAYNQGHFNETVTDYALAVLAMAEELGGESA